MNKCHEKKSHKCKCKKHLKYRAKGVSTVASLSLNPISTPEQVVECTGVNPEFSTGPIYHNSQAEPYIASNPLDKKNMVAAWIEDRWAYGGGGASIGVAYTKDEGKTWTQVQVPFSKCSGGEGFTGDYERNTDPWVQFGIDGACYVACLGYNLDRFTPEDPRFFSQTFLVAKSLDGGMTFGTPVITVPIGGFDDFYDKETLTVHPRNPNLLYLTYVNIRGLIGTGDTTLNVVTSSDGGLTWSLPVLVASENNEPVSFLGAIIQVLPNDDLVNAFENVDENYQLCRSSDNGATWTNPIDIYTPTLNGGVSTDIEVTNELGMSTTIPTSLGTTFVGILSSNNKTGTLYYTIADSKFNSNQLGGTVIIKSTDGGFTWSDPIPVNPSSLSTQAFLGFVSVADNGNVGVLFYDFRDDFNGDIQLTTDVWLAVFDPELEHRLSEVKLTEKSMDSRQFLGRTSGSDNFYFPGDYVGLATNENNFYACWANANDNDLPLQTFPIPAEELTVDNNNRQDIVFAKVSACETKCKQAKVDMSRFRDFTPFPSNSSVLKIQKTDDSESVKKGLGRKGRMLKAHDL